MAFVDDLKSELEYDDNPIVKCGCGRDVNADMMRDVRPIQDLIQSRSVGRHPCDVAIKTSAYACDSCLEYHFNVGNISRKEYYEAHGATKEQVAIQADRDSKLQEMRDSGAVKIQA
jgi:hypothetical protein